MRRGGGLPAPASCSWRAHRTFPGGPGRFEDGKRVPPLVAAGDEVIYSKYGGTEIKVDGEDLLILRESDVLAKAV